MYNILIVDDEYYICEGLNKKISLLNLPDIGEIRTCLSGEAALDICKTYKPQIVFTDIKMNGMDGIRLIHSLSQKLHPVQFIVLSGYDDFNYVKGAFQNGAIDYLLKPIMNEDLSRILSTAFSNLNKDSHIPHKFRGSLFQLSADFLQKLALIPADTVPPQSFLSVLSDGGIEKSCCIAILAFHSPQTYDIMNSQINFIYDTFEHVLCNTLSPFKIGIICPAENYEYLKSILSSVVHKNPNGCAASLIGPESLSRITGLFQKAEKYICFRLSKGYGQIFTETMSMKKKGISQKLKHMTSQFIDSPSLFTNNVQRKLFNKEIEKLPIPDLITYYHYFNEILGASLSDLNLSEWNHRFPSLSSFSDYETLEAYFNNRIMEYSQKVSLQPQHSGSLDLIRNYVDIHYMENLTLADLADRFFISYSHLSKSFHETFHMSFRDYLRMLRMEHALALLKDPNHSIQQIAVDVGYENAFNFSRAFKAQYGVSPNHFRNNG
ncbi:MAG: helix-turn-helix domain-containing protein [Clostridiales bacterium]|nr:helix-turn-helix domain-containing protein [Clostridiales bacterium]